METGIDLKQLYRELADDYERRDQPQFRDRFLVLAADAALSSGDEGESEIIRQQLLAVNPHHLLKPYASFAQAMQVADIQMYVSALRRDYPTDVATRLLRAQKESAEPAKPAVPVTAPLLNLGDPPDLLMGETEKPLIYPFRDDASPGIPPTLPPNKFPRRNSAGAPPARPLPSSYDAHLPPTVPPPLRPKSPPRDRPKAAPAPALRAAAPPRPAIKARPIPFADSTPSPTNGDGPGAWFTSLLLGVFGLAGLALAGYTLIYPFLAAKR
jgi:hypothetical protein